MPPRISPTATSSLSRPTFSPCLLLPESFDVIYSIGVLHHTPDCEAAVKALDKYLKPGGLLVVWLYSGYNKWYRFSDFWRRYTHKMKPETLHGILKVAVPFFYNLQQGLKHVPLVGRPAAGLVHHVFPVNRQKDPEARMLDTFDWYSPKYQSKHTYEQVFKWYEAMGMEDMRVGEISIAVRGRKPARAGLAPSCFDRLQRVGLVGTQDESRQENCVWQESVARRDLASAERARA